MCDVVAASGPVKTKTARRMGAWLLGNYIPDAAEYGESRLVSPIPGSGV